MNKIYLKELYLTYPIKDLFHTLTKNLVVKIDEKKYPEWIFYFNENNNCIFQYNTKNGYFWCNYELYWNIFYENFNFNYIIVRDITKDMVENHFKLKGITPKFSSISLYFMVENHFKLKGITPEWIKRMIKYLVESHFKLKGITPVRYYKNLGLRVEEHFKLKGITPIDLI